MILLKPATTCIGSLVISKNRRLRSSSVIIKCRTVFCLLLLSCGLHAAIIIAGETSSIITV